MVKQFGDDVGSSKSILVEAATKGQLLLFDKPHDSEEIEFDKDADSTPVSPSSTPKKMHSKVKIRACTRSSTVASPPPKKGVVKISRPTTTSLTDLQEERYKNYYQGP